jgi:hypothetical protein
MEDEAPSSRGKDGGWWFPEKITLVMIYVAGALCIGNGVMFLIQGDVGLGLASVIVGAAITVQRVLLNRKRWGLKVRVQASALDLLTSAFHPLRTLAAAGRDRCIRTVE